VGEEMQDRTMTRHLHTANTYLTTLALGVIALASAISVGIALRPHPVTPPDTREWVCRPVAYPLANGEGVPNITRCHWEAKE
jgi:hypothetical protein